MPGQEDIHERIGKLETSVAGIASSVETLVDSQKHVWAAIEKLSTRGEMSWGKIVSTGGFVLAIATGAATMNNALLEGRIRQVEIRAEDQKEIRQAEAKTDEVRAQFLLRMCDENHEAIRRLRDE